MVALQAANQESPPCSIMFFKLSHPVDTGPNTNVTSDSLYLQETATSVSTSAEIHPPAGSRWLTAAETVTTMYVHRV